MAFCSNCGQQLDDKAKFCSACGTPNPAQQAPQEEKRKTVYEGRETAGSLAGRTSHFILY